MKRFLILLSFIGLSLFSCQSGSETKTPVKLVKKTVLDLQPLQFAERAEAPNALLLDIRTAKEIKEKGSIKGSQHIDFYEPNFVENVEKLDKNKQLLIYCASGGRSAKAANQLSQKGFAEVINLKGGHTAWKRAFPDK